MRIEACPTEAGTAPANQIDTQDGNGRRGTSGNASGNGQQHSGLLCDRIDRISRPATAADTALTELEQYKVHMRRFAPVEKGLPWACQSRCLKCDHVVPSRFIHEAAEDNVYLDFDCPNCGAYRELHHDALFVKDTDRHRVPERPRQPRTTLAGHPIRPIVPQLPKTVETLCPECSAIILGRYFEKDGAVWIEKTCPDHGHFDDKVNSDAGLWEKAQHGCFEDERGAARPQVTGAGACPSDCGLCNQHTSTAVLPQIDLTNRCNLTCPVCFANANVAGHVSEPDFDMVVQMLTNLRNLHPVPATAVQFTGGEPTIHPDFHRIVAKAKQMGFSHIQIATNGITHANLEFAERSAEAGLHTLYMQFDGVEEHFFRKLRREDLLEKKLKAIENCAKTGMKVALVPTIVRNFNDHQVGPIFQFAVRNVHAVSAIAYQPVSFSGRIARHELREKRYTLGDLAHDIAAASGAKIERDFFPLGLVSPLSRIMSCIDGKPKVTASCHSDCAFGSYFFVTPDHKAVPVPEMFDIFGLMQNFNELARKIKSRHEKASRFELAQIAWAFIKNYRWRNASAQIKPWTFIRALQGLTDKSKGRGHAEKKSYKTLMAAGMHFMDRYNYDAERVKRCVILYSTVDGIYPFCTINCGPEYRPFIERMYGKDKVRWQAENPEIPLRPSSDPDAVLPWMRPV